MLPLHSRHCTNRSLPFACSTPPPTCVSSDDIDVDFSLLFGLIFLFPFFELISHRIHTYNTSKIMKMLLREIICFCVGVCVCVTYTHVLLYRNIVVGCEQENVIYLPVNSCSNRLRVTAGSRQVVPPPPSNSDRILWTWCSHHKHRFQSECTRAFTKQGEYLW